MGLPGLSRAAGFTTSFAPTTSATSVTGELVVGLLHFLKRPLQSLDKLRARSAMPICLAMRLGGPLSTGTTLAQELDYYEYGNERRGRMPTWIEQIFTADQAQNNGIVRRDAEEVRRQGREQELLDEVRRLRFHLIETGGQFVILCHQGSIIIHL
jgi:hypothetical protein